MTEHLSNATLSALADGELAADELHRAREHFAGCAACASSATEQWLLKSAVAKAGRRYDMPVGFEQRMAAAMSGDLSSTDQKPFALRMRVPRRATRWITLSGWAAAAVLLCLLSGWAFFERSAHERVAMVSEACDLHIAALSASQPQVLSSDRHTVKPWFQGKLPFSFNLPETLPADTRLDGANVTYLDGRPVAQLLFSIGRHRVSVFLEQRPAQKWGAGSQETTHAGFHVMAFNAGELAGSAVSDVEPARLEELVRTLQQAQASR